MIRDNKKLVFISSRQNELQKERNLLREFINSTDTQLPKLFIARTFEVDLTGRSENVNRMTEEWVLKSDIYLGIFDREYSEATKHEYNTAINDKLVKKEIIIFVRSRKREDRESSLAEFLDKLMHLEKGHSCIAFNDTQDLLDKAKRALLNYYGRTIEGFIISEDVLGPNLDGARDTDFPEKLRRKLLQPVGRFLVPIGRKGIPEYFIYDWNGEKIDVTWDYIKDDNISEDKKEFYRKRYRKSFEE